MKTVTPPEQYLKTPITRRDGTIICRRCGLQLGEIDSDGQYLQAGNIRLFGRYQKYFCICGKPYNFSERDLAGGNNRADFPAVTHEILNELGKDYNVNYLQQNHARQEDEEEDF